MATGRWLRVALGAALAVLITAGPVRSQDATPGFPDEPAPLPAPSAPPASSASEGAPARVVTPAPVTPPPPPILAPITPQVAPPGSGFPFVPYMLGDFIGPLANPMTDMKVSEGESPIPLDRVFYRFNVYSGIDPSRYGSPYQPYSSVNLWTNVFGFEKTFWDGIGSIGLRVPINVIQANSRGYYYVNVGGKPVKVAAPPTYNSSEFGNINAIFKFRLFEDLGQGTLASAGAAISFPTATYAYVDPGASTGAMLQPFGAFVYNPGRFYAQGFTSVTVPLVSVQSFIWFTDVGVGYWVYRDPAPSAFLSGIAPTFEMHFNAPLQSSARVGQLYDSLGALPFHTQFNLTFGGTFEFGHKATLGLGFVLPTAGPLPFNYEFLAHLNWRF